MMTKKSTIKLRDKTIRSILHMAKYHSILARNARAGRALGALSERDYADYRLSSNMRHGYMHSARIVKTQFGDVL